MADFVIIREGDGHHGRYVVRHDGTEAELTYTVVAPDRVTADHTGVPDSLRGTGAGQAMVSRMVADARVEGFRILALCPFVDAQRKKHPEWADAFSV